MIFFVGLLSPKLLTLLMWLFQQYSYNQCVFRNNCPFSMTNMLLHGTGNAYINVYLSIIMHFLWKTCSDTAPEKHMHSSNWQTICSNDVGFGSMTHADTYKYLYPKWLSPCSKATMKPRSQHHWSWTLSIIEIIIRACACWEPCVAIVGNHCLFHIYIYVIMKETDIRNLYFFAFVTGERNCTQLDLSSQKASDYKQMICRLIINNIEKK